MSLFIRDLPGDDRPRERIQRYGATNVSNAELLAVVWRTGHAGRSGAEGEGALGLAQRALAHFGSLSALACASAAQLRGIKGIGAVKAIELQAALELGRRVAVAAPEERAMIQSPADVVRLVHPEMALLEQEELWLILLNSKNAVLGVRRVYRGTVNSSAVRVAELFRAAIRENAVSVVIVHNHPSNDPTPSPEDVRVTDEAVRAGALLDVEVLDHVIVGASRDRFISLKERGLGFAPSASP